MPLAERGFRPLRRHAPTGFRLGLATLSLLVIVYFALRTVFVPVAQFSSELLLLQTQSLTGVKGQTMLSPPRGLARIDFRLSTEVEPGGWVRVKFELKPDPASPDAYGSGIVVFRESREDWRVSLRFPPDLVPPGERFYVRAEAILSSPRDRLYYWYARTDEYPTVTTTTWTKRFRGRICSSPSTASRIVPGRWAGSRLSGLAWLLRHARRAPGQGPP